MAFLLSGHQNEIAKPCGDKNELLLSSVKCRGIITGGEVRGEGLNNNNNKSILDLSRVGFGMLPPPMYILLANMLRNWEAL